MAGRKVLRLLLESTGTLAICSSVEVMDSKNEDEYVDRAKKATEPIFQQGQSMAVEYARMYARIELEMKRHLEETVGNVASNRARAGGWFGGLLGKNGGSGGKERDNPRDWDAFLNEIVQASEEELERRFDVDEMFATFDDSKYQEKFRTILREETLAYTTFTDRGDPLSIFPNVTPPIKFSNIPPVSTAQVLQQGSSNDNDNALAPEDDSTSAGTATSQPQQASQNNHKQQPRLSGEEELLKILDVIAKKLTKLEHLNDKFDTNFESLLKEHEKRIERSVKPIEAIEDTVFKSFLKVLGVVSLMILTERLLPVAGAAKAASNLLSPLSTTATTTAKATLKNRFPQVLRVLVSISFISTAFTGHRAVQDWLTTQPLTEPFIRWLAEDDDDEDEEESVRNKNKNTNGGNQGGKALSAIDSLFSSDEFSDGMDEDEAKVLQLLREEAPSMQVWYGSQVDDPFRIERIINYDILPPLTDMPIFLMLLLNSMAKYVNPIVAHLVTMLTYSLYRDNIVDPQRAFMKLPTLESMANSLVSSLLNQFQFVACGSIFYPIVTNMLANLHLTISDFSSSLAFAKEFQIVSRYAWGVSIKQNILAMTSFYRDLEILRQRTSDKSSPSLSSSSSTSTSENSSFKLGGSNPNVGGTGVNEFSLVGEILSFIFLPTSSTTSKQGLGKYLDASHGYELRREWKDCVDRVIDTFSSDYFAESSSKRISVEDCVDFVSAMDALIRREVVVNNDCDEDTVTPILGPKLNIWKDFFADFEGKGAFRSEASKLRYEQLCAQLGGDMSKVNSLITTQRQVIIGLHLAQLTFSLENLYPKGLTKKEFEDFFLFTLVRVEDSLRENNDKYYKSNNNKENEKEKEKRHKRDVSNSLLLQPQSLIEKLTEWEHLSPSPTGSATGGGRSIEDFLDLIQHFYSHILQSNVNAVTLFEPEIFSSLRQQLSGRRPLIRELNDYFTRFNRYTQLSIDRAKIDYLLYGHNNKEKDNEKEKESERQSNENTFHYYGGLTDHHFALLRKKYSMQYDEVDQLCKEWEEYFERGSIHRKKLYDAIMSNPMDMPINRKSDNKSDGSIAVNNARERRGLYTLFLLTNRFQKGKLVLNNNNNNNNGGSNAGQSPTNGAGENEK